MKSFAQKESSLRWDSPSVQVLFQLLRIALGKEEPSPLPNCVNWQEVYELSLRQGVGAIACDGLLKLEECSIDEDLKYKWMGQSMVIEENYMLRWNIICRLSALFAQQGINTRVLKGAAYASYYPCPNHRVSTDLDICLLDDFEKGNQIVEEMGIEVNRNDSKHSHFTINGVHVENHQFCVGVRGNRKNKKLERYFKKLLSVRGDTLKGSCAYDPQWLFNALFFMCHARNHFLIEKGITLKFLCDWIVMRDAEDARKNLNQFWEDCSNLGLKQFAEVIDEIADYMLGKCGVSDAGAIMLDDIIYLHEETMPVDDKLRAHIQIISTIWNNRWKFRYYSDMTALGLILTYIWGYIFDRHPDL